jgi:aspartate-semialdehyde dehydrogenase
MSLAHLESLRSLAIVGATGLVGREVLTILAENHIRIPVIKALASEKSAGEEVEYGDRMLPVESLTTESFHGVQAALFSAPNEISKKYIPIASAAGCLCIDDSSVFRMDPEVPLIVPEVNAEQLRDFTGLVTATPNCSTTPLVMVLKPLLERYGLERVIVSSYQSVSGAGRAAYQELSEQTVNLLSGKASEAKVFPHRIAFNCLPQIGKALDTGESDEEAKIQNETRKILGVKNLRIAATAVRVPTFAGHGLSVNIEFTDSFETVEQVRDLLDTTAGVKVLDKPEGNIYPTNAEATGSDEVFVGRIRRDTSVESGVNLWIIGDNLRKGAALNSLQILDTYLYYKAMN